MQISRQKAMEYNDPEVTVPHGGTAASGRRGEFTDGCKEQNPEQFRRAGENRGM